MEVNVNRNMTLKSSLEKKAVGMEQPTGMPIVGTAEIAGAVFLILLLVWLLFGDIIYAKVIEWL